MTKITAIIATYNEEKNIRECLESINWVNEIIVVDMFSADDTLKICREYTAKIFQNDSNRRLNINKNIGIQQASGDWVLEVDADERISLELRSEIIQAVENESYAGYWVPFRTFWFGKFLRFGGWREWHIRLYRKANAGYECKIVHEPLKIEGKLGRLKNPISHFAHRSISEHLKKTDLYTTQEANDSYGMGIRFSLFNLVILPVKSFAHRYFILMGFMDGLHGLIVSLLMAFYSATAQMKLWEIENFNKNKDR